ncbi:MAG TPA: transposase [Candidatus Cloacimonadota bacterium]|nr:transposase [Candidatus Cloacimonadota bacterium]
MLKSKLDYRYFYRRNLPHIQPVGAIFFVTYRLAFDLPDEIIDNLRELRKFYDSKMIDVDELEKRKLEQTCNKYIFEAEDDYFNVTKTSPCWLQRKDIADIVLNSLIYNHKRQYDLRVAVIMPNHVHIIFQPLSNSSTQISLAKIMKDHKSYTANECNKILHRNGQFWHHENYDHYIRDGKEYEQNRNYILNNPVKAQLTDHYKNWEYIIDYDSETDI